jgi:serine/threonine-protein kinase HipA
MPEKEPQSVRLTFLEQPMAALVYRQDGAHLLEFDPAYLAAGHDLSPVNLPIEQQRSARVFRAGDSPFVAGLPGLIADSLPDAWGDRVLRAEMPSIQTPVGKLAAIGRRGPGAITFEPAIGSGRDDATESVNLAKLADAAAELAATSPLTTAQVDAALARGGSSLGGAYPKTSAHLPLAGEFLERREILIGGATPSGHVPCILKFSPVTPDGGGALEFAYWKMAKSAGIRVPRACLVFDGARRHFAVERFDRYIKADGTTGRKHVHTLSGLLHQRASDGQLDYTDFMRLSRRLCGQSEATECFRRAVFNLMALNRDDHGRNHAYLYDEATRTWTLAPAYDLNPSVANVLVGLSWFGSAALPKTLTELIRFAELGGMRRSDVLRIFGEVEEAVLGGWDRLAAACDIPREIVAEWGKEMKKQTKELRSSVARARSV